MKSTACTCLLSLALLTRVTVLGAAEAEPKLPEDARRLKAAYQEASERAVQPLRERYLIELKRLLEQATRAGKLADAVALQHEITSLAPGGAFSTSTPAALAESLENSSWTFTTDTGQSRKLTFKAGGALVFDDGFKCSWDVVDALHVKTDIGTFTFSSDTNQFEFVRPNKKVWIGRRSHK